MDWFRQMKKGGGKGKGSAFERKVCAQLSLWVTNGKKKDVFWRSSMSGGRATIHVKRGDKNRQAGDIAAVAAEGYEFTDVFFVECKHVKSLALQGFFLSNIGPLAKFWKKVSKQARDHGKLPMIIAKQNMYPVVVVTTRDVIAADGGWLCAGRHVRVARFDRMLRGSHDDFRARYRRQTGLYEREK
jgi:hypothetical protein